MRSWIGERSSSKDISDFTLTAINLQSAILLMKVTARAATILQSLIHAKGSYIIPL